MEVSLIYSSIRVPYDSRSKTVTVQYVDANTWFIGVDRFAGVRVMLTHDLSLNRPTGSMWLDETNCQIGIFFLDRRKLKLENPQLMGEIF